LLERKRIVAPTKRAQAGTRAISALRNVFGRVIKAQFSLETHATLLIAKITETNQGLTGFFNKLVQAIAIDRVRRVRWSNREPKAGIESCRVRRKFDLDVLLPTADFEQQTRHNNICRVDDVFNAHIPFRGWFGTQSPGNV
jgi:hypothetical protein